MCRDNKKNKMKLSLFTQILTLFIISSLLFSDISCTLKTKKKKTLRHNKLKQSSSTNKDSNNEMMNQRIGLFVIVPIVIIVLLLTLASIIGFIMLIVKTPSINESNLRQSRILQYLSYQSQNRIKENLIKKRESDIVRLPEPESDNVMF